MMIPYIPHFLGGQILLLITLLLWRQRNYKWMRRREVEHISCDWSVGIFLLYLVPAINWHQDATCVPLLSSVKICGEVCFFFFSFIILPLSWHILGLGDRFCLDDSATALFHSEQIRRQSRFNNKKWRISTDARTGITNGLQSHSARWALMMDGWTNDGSTSIIRVKLNDNEP